MNFNIVIYFNTVTFCFVAILYINKIMKEKLYYKGIFEKVGGENVNKILILDYSDSNYRIIDQLLSTINGNDNAEQQTILFISPKWLFELKRKTWKRYSTIHVSSFDNIAMVNGSTLLIRNKRGKIKVITETIQYLRQAEKLRS